jgi:capsular exopolysaccharide synthesis family protein
MNTPMDTPDRPDGHVPSWPPAPLPAQPPRPSWDELPQPAGPAPRAFSPKVVWRAFRRHWWQILALWVVASAGLASLAYYKIKPTYDAVAWLKVEPTSRTLLAQTYADQNFQATLETNVQLITSPDVLGAAVVEPKVAGLPRVRNSLDPEKELSKELKVNVLRGTHVIQVAMSSESPTEAATIVNTVVKAFLKASSGWTDHETRVQIEQLRELKKRFEGERDKQRATLRKLNQQAVQSTIVDPKDPNLVTLESYRQFQAQLSEVQIRRIAAESALKTTQEYWQDQANRAKNRRGTGAAEPSQMDIDRAMRRDPELAKIQADMADVRERMNRVQRLTADTSDPSYLTARRKYEGLVRHYRDTYNERLPEVRQALMRNPEEGRDADNGATEIRQALLQVEQLKTQEAALADKLKKLEIQTRAEGGEALEIQFVRADLAYSDQMLETIERNLGQLEYESTGGAKVNLIAEARPSPKPSSNKRLAVMAATPVGVLGLLMGLFVLIEARAARVGDPDDLSARVRVGVIGVVPPLPTLRPSRGPRSARDEKRRVEEFVQSLDHLRVTLCSGKPGTAAARRCVLITSACGGEGKTTLAAQLAGRCANAGLLTLLIDADLRRPSLGELLEVPEGPGLVDVLLGEADPESAMVVIGNAGGFHLLPAGTPGHDPSRLLQGDRLGHLLARLRATFDVVIVDAPPVLAVPDALLLGRWVDGAVLAVRHDTSRYPLVERANRRLASIGIPVLGAVVNGVRTVESYYGYGGYGAYHYASYASTGPEPEPPQS